MDVRSIEDMAPVIEHNGTTPVWWLVPTPGDAGGHRGWIPGARERVGDRRRRSGSMPTRIRRTSSITSSPVTGS